MVLLKITSYYVGEFNVHYDFRTFKQFFVDHEKNKSLFILEPLPLMIVLKSIVC